MNKQPFYNYIADYKIRSGEDFFNVFQIPCVCVKNEQDGARLVKQFLIKQGYAPEIIVNVSGNYTLDELQLIAEGKLYSKQMLIDCLKHSPIGFM